VIAEVDTLVDRYCAVWSEPNADRRAELLASVWTRDATYADPSVETRTPEDLLAHIAGVREQRPGSRVVRTSTVDCHHRVGRFLWMAVQADGSVLRKGIDFAEFSQDGTRLQRVYGFVGPLDEKSGDQRV
jgi:hypothetical protein